MIGMLSPRRMISTPSVERTRVPKISCFSLVIHAVPSPVSLMRGKAISSFMPRSSSSRMPTK
jgi:hypothetical protein